MPTDITGQLRHRLMPVVILITAPFFSMPVPSHADDYLNALEAEAKNVQGEPDTTTAKPESSWSHNDMGMADALKPKLSQKAFELSLKRNFIGSYTVYSRLNTAEKGEVYTAYQERNDIDELKALIKQLYK
jgi:hypothetical protein